jgi:RHS repeat-associated protein
MSSFSGTRDHLKGYYSSKPDPGPNGVPMTYYSFDGSFLWAVINPDNANFPIRWELYLPDGTKIVQRRGSGIQRVTDTNGNRVEIQTIEHTPGVFTTHYKDQETGREIQKVATLGGGTQVRYQTVGGTWVNIDLAFGTTTVKGKTFTVTDDNGQGGTCERTELMDDVGLDVLRSITLPVTQAGQPGKQYLFSYNSDTTETGLSLPYKDYCGQPNQTATVASRGMGSLSQIAMPMGALVQYAYNLDSNHILLSADNTGKETITTKTVVHDGTSDVWGYGISDIGGSVANPDGTGVQETKYPHSRDLPGWFGGVDGKSGLVYRSTTADKIVERKWARLKFTGGDEASPGGKVTFNPVVDTEFTTLLNAQGQPAKMSAKQFQYDFNGNVTSETVYDWFSPSSVSRDAEGLPLAVPAGATVLRTTSNTYYNQAPGAGSGNVYAIRTDPPSPLILNAIQETITGASKTRFSYDNQAYGVAPLVGNLTEQSSLENTGGPWLPITHGYDSYGNLTSTTDASGNTTVITYDSATNAQPVSVTVDPNSQVGGDELTTQTSYDYSTGLVLTVTDPNGKQTSTSYNNQLLGSVDPFGRPGTVIDPLGRQTQTRYHDNERRVEVWSDLNSQGDTKLRSQTSVDKLGRTIKTESSEDGSTYSISSDVVYHFAGRITFTSNPHRSSPASTDGWTRTTKNNAGRVTEVATFPGASLPAVTGTSGSTGVVTSAYDAHATTVTDQATKVRRSIVDALGRLIRVDEPNSSGSLGTIDAPAQPTSYTYDPLGNLTSVAQGVQTRTFTYDGLSRLKTATNPESGAINYTYYPNGNLLTKTDARSVVTTYVYDGLNRVKTRSYSGPGAGGATPAVTYVYDTMGAALNGKGRLTSVSSSVSSTTIGSYDAAGRVLASTQTTDGQSYPMSYQYNLAGGMTSETYPSGRVVATEYDSAGRIAGVKKDPTTYYAGGTSGSGLIGYSSHGAMNSLKLGNGLWEHTNFNSRLQPEEIGLGTSSTDSSKLRLDYGYGAGSTNNGNILSQRIVVSGAPGLDVRQDYTYDELNRLKTATEVTTSGSVQQWKQTYDYDRYGNRAVRTPESTIGMSVLTPQSAFAGDMSAFNASNNRIQVSGFAYLDGVGNLTADPTTAADAMVYDGENKQVSYSKAGATTQYFYDGDGHRVKKYDVTADVTTVFVYNVNGQLIAEYTDSTQPPIGEGGTSYLTTDHLSSTRVVTKQNGGVKVRYDFLPFGEEIEATIGGRTAGLGYSAADSTKQKFTQKERDAESDLDYFGARYYSGSQGRFTGSDPIPVTKENFVNPQRWNLYIYVNNNPLTAIDPTGGDGKGKGGDKVISVFLEFTAEDRNFTTVRDRQLPEPGPSWAAAQSAASRNGFQLDLYHNYGLIEGAKASSSAAFEEALNNSDVVIYIGHGLGDGNNSPYYPTYVAVGGDTAYGNGGKGIPNGASYFPTGARPATTANVVCLFACNTASNGNSFFTFTGDGQQRVVTVNSGKDGYTAVGTLEKAAKAFVDIYVSTNGDLKKATKAFNEVLKADKERKYKDTKINEGDKAVIQTPQN